MFQRPAIEKAVASILVAIGEDPGREGLRDTPQRVADMYQEVFSGLGADPAKELAIGFEEGHEGLVLLRDIPFFSMCEHHLLPFFGTGHIAYFPTGRLAGASKLARALEVLSCRPQLQERLTSQMADVLMETLHPDAVAVVLKAEHLCMVMRGVKKPGSNVVTTATRGAFKTAGLSQGELLALVMGG